jgi:hypothetical protein
MGTRRSPGVTRPYRGWPLHIASLTFTVLPAIDRIAGRQADQLLGGGQREFASLERPAASAAKQPISTWPNLID